MQRTRRKKRNSRRVRKQKEVIREVMLTAGRWGMWLTLDELAKLTKFPPASISAQLRHLRKPQNGAFDVEKRVRRVAKALQENGLGAVWEYRMWRGLPCRRQPRLPNKSQKGLRAAVDGAGGRAVGNSGAAGLALQPAGL